MGLPSKSPGSVGNSNAPGGSSLVARTVREALEAVASPNMTVRILHRALHMARIHEVPGGGQDLRLFVSKHLKAAVDFAMGPETAEALLDDLEPILRMADELEEVSRVRMSNSTQDMPAVRDEPDAMPSLPPLNFRNPKVPKAPPAGIKAPITRDVGPSTRPPPRDPFESDVRLRDDLAVPTVLVTTLDLDRLHKISGHLAGEATVQLVGDVVELLEALQSAVRPIVIIDCMDPSVQPMTIATIAADIPEGSTVVVWGANATVYNQVESLAEHTKRWLRCGIEASSDDVSSLIQQLVA